MFEKPALPTDFCCLGNNLLGDTAVVLLYATCDGAGLGTISRITKLGGFQSTSGMVIKELQMLLNPP